MRIIYILLLLFSCTASAAGNQNVHPFNNPKMVIANGDRSFALDKGNIWVWGHTDGYITKRFANILYDPEKVLTEFDQEIVLSDVEKIVPAANFTIAVLVDGTSYILGEAKRAVSPEIDEIFSAEVVGEMAMHTIYRAHSPEKLRSVYKLGNMSLKHVNSISYEYEYSIALMDDGTVWQWESPHYRKSSNIEPNLVIQNPHTKLPLNNVKKVLALPFSERGLALKNDGTVWAWGDITSVSGAHMKSNVAVQLLSDAISRKPLKNVKDIAVISGNQFYSLKNDGTVWLHKSIAYDFYEPKFSLRKVFNIDIVNYSFKKALNITDNRCPPAGAIKKKPSVPEQVFMTSHSTEALTDVVAINAQDKSFSALKMDGTVWTWMYKHSRVPELASQTDIEQVKVKYISVPLTDIVKISAGRKHNLALKKDGTIWAWGENNWGQLGVGSSVKQNKEAVQVGL